MHYLIVLSQLKNEAMTLETWIKHYIWQGCDHIYLIDNGSTDESVDIINKYINDGFPITLDIIPTKHNQVGNMREVYDKYDLQTNTKWLINADLDEFWYVPNSTLKETLPKFEKYDIVIGKWLLFGSDGWIEQPKDIRTAIKKRKKESAPNTKWIVQTKHLKSEGIDVHNVHTNENKTFCDEDVFRLNHYPIQSLDFFKKVKMTRGDVASGAYENVRDMSYFEEYDKFTDTLDETLKNLVTRLEEFITIETNDNSYWRTFFVCNFMLVLVVFIIFIRKLVNNFIPFIKKYN
jgi:glycosyltransferase involved in cell wall biosynthesis